MNEETFGRSDTMITSKVGKVALELDRANEAFEVGNYRLVIDITKRLLGLNEKIHQAHYLTGRVAIETRQLDIALKNLETAIALIASTSDYWAFLGLVHSQTGNLEKAGKSVKKAQEIGSDKASVLCIIGQVLSILGDFDGANKNLRKAVHNSPNEGIYHHFLGVNLIETGNLKGAQQSLQKAVAINENDAQSWWSLSSLVTAKNNGMAEQLISIMKTTESSPMAHSLLGYAAGKLFEDTECWDRAFKAFDRAGAEKRRTVTYDSLQANKTFEELKTVCTGNWLQNSIYEQNDSTPIFIIGQPRTGTTLVDRIISSHSLVYSAGEPVQLAMSLRSITGVRTKEFISAELIRKSKNVTGVELAESYLSGLANLRGNTPYFIDKFPMNFMLVGFIVKAFPKAKIIHVTRGPADTCFAVFKQLFGDVYQHSYNQCEMAEHYVMYRNLMEHWHAIMPGKIYDIAYEDIVTDNQVQARKLIQYIGLDWEDACTSFEKNKAAVATASAAQVRDKVHGRSVGRWKKYKKQLSPTLDILEAAGINP